MIKARKDNIVIKTDEEAAKYKAKQEKSAVNIKEIVKLQLFLF